MKGRGIVIAQGIPSEWVHDILHRHGQAVLEVIAAIADRLPNIRSCDMLQGWFSAVAAESTGRSSSSIKSKQW